MVLGLKPENVRVIFRRGSGCYGLNGADTVTYDAAMLSQAVGKPVRVQLMRKDEMAWENYGNAFVMDERAGPRCAGQHHRVGSRSVVSRAREPAWHGYARQR
jgi:nicotinate dehydrogenase subunit B